MGILLMTLTHLVLFVPISMRTKAIGIATAFSSGIVGELERLGRPLRAPRLRLSEDRLLPRCSRARSCGW